MRSFGFTLLMLGLLISLSTNAHASQDNPFDCTKEVLDNGTVVTTCHGSAGSTTTVEIPGSTFDVVLYTLSNGDTTTLICTNFGCVMLGDLK